MDSGIQSAYRFLFDNAQPVIRLEAATALGIETDELRKAMLEHPQVRYWIDCSRRFAEKPQIHNGADTCLENWMHKLLSFGVREGDDPWLSQINSDILKFMVSNRPDQRFYDTINPTIAASWLVCTGHRDSLLISLIRERVEAVHGFVKEKSYDIYVSPEGYPAIPAARKTHPLVNPFLYENNVWKLPTVHDMFAYANLPAALREDQEIMSKIDEIVDYVLDERYQRLNTGYGLMLVPPNKYYGMGWSVHLNNYFNTDEQTGSGGLVWALELMSHFGRARKSEWFKRNLGLLGKYESQGLYEFPPQFLNEGKDKYYVGGGHMGLGEDRKKGSALKIESTAWMLRILSNLEH